MARKTLCRICKDEVEKGTILCHYCLIFHREIIRIFSRNRSQVIKYLNHILVKEGEYRGSANPEDFNLYWEEGKEREDE